MREYYQIRQISIRSGLEEFIVFTRPGVPNGDQISPSVSLLADHTTFPSGSRILMMGCGNGILALLLSKRTSWGECWLTDINHTALNMAEFTLEFNRIGDYQICRKISLLPAYTDYFDAILIDIPKGRKLLRRWLVEVYYLLHVGGKLFISGANDLGIKSAISDCQDLFASKAVILAYRKGNRVAEFEKTENAVSSPSWSSQDGIAPGTWYQFNAKLFSLSFHIDSLPGIFSFEKVDDGTRILVENMDIEQGCHMLDVGCGYGLIGLVGGSRSAGRIVMIDNNLHATASAQKNLEKLDGISGKVITADLLETVRDEKYHLISSNPPFHLGLPVDMQVTQVLIEESWDLLEPRGIFIIVVNQFLNYEEKIRNVFNNIEVPYCTKRYKILKAIRK